VINTIQQSQDQTAASLANELLELQKLLAATRLASNDIARKAAKVNKVLLVVAAGLDKLACALEANR